MFHVAAIDFVFVLPFVVCLGVGAAAYWIMDHFAARDPRTDERLAKIKDPLSGRRSESDSNAKTTDAVVNMLKKASPALAKPLQSKEGTTQEGKLKQRLFQGGFRSETAPTIFLGLKFIGLAVGLLCGGATAVLRGDYSTFSLVSTALLLTFLFVLPDIVLWFISRRRKDAIFRSLPDTLDLMVVCVEAGLGLDQAMRRVAEEMKNTYRAICEEIALSNFHLQMGRPRTEVLHDLGQRTGVDDVRALTSVLIQAEKFGTGVGQALRAHSDSMRTRRRQMAEEKAAKTAVKMLIPLVLFIFPGIFVILIGPAAISIMRQFAQGGFGGGY